MKVDFSHETESGPVTFIGNLNEDEVNFLIEYAITDLVRKGVLPFAVNRDPDSASKFMRGSEITQ